jgi:flagellar basal body-associated protein FliL
MNRKYLIAIIVAAIVVVGLIVVIPNLGAADGTTVTTLAGGTAPPISPDATVPDGHPSVDGGTGSGAGTAEDLVKTAEEAYNADPKNIGAILDLADAYLQANSLDDATRVLNEALALEPNNSTAKAGLAMVDFTKGDAAGAQTKLEAVTAEAPNDQVALYDLAIVYFSTDQRDKAKETWAKASAVDPTSDLGQMAQQFVDMMGQTEASGASPHGADGGMTGTTSASGATPTTTQ